jgi:hypothetical protein
VVLGGGLLSFMFPSVFWSNNGSLSQEQGRAFYGFCVLMGLALIHMLKKQSALRRIRQDLFLERETRAQSPSSSVCYRNRQRTKGPNCCGSAGVNISQTLFVRAWLYRRLLTSAPMISPETTSSTRRFRWRPAAVSFEATGMVFPKPFAVTEVAGIPCSTR